MKKFLVLIAICLLASSCSNNSNNVENNNSNNSATQQATENNANLVKRVDTSTSIYISNSDIKFKEFNVKDALASNALTIDDIIDNTAFVTLSDSKSYMYIIDQIDPFYLVVCNNDTNHNIYINTDFDASEKACNQ